MVSSLGFLLTLRILDWELEKWEPEMSVGSDQKKRGPSKSLLSPAEEPGNGVTRDLRNLTTVLEKPRSWLELSRQAGQGRSQELLSQRSELLEWMRWLG